MTTPAIQYRAMKDDIYFKDFITSRKLQLVYIYKNKHTLISSYVSSYEITISSDLTLKD